MIPRTAMALTENERRTLARMIEAGEEIPGVWRAKLFAATEIPPEWTVHGVGIVKAEVVRKADLEVQADENPPDGLRHANIVRWPVLPDDPEETKNIWKDLWNSATGLAPTAPAFRNPPSSNPDS